MAVIRNKSLSQKDKHNWKVVLPRIVNMEKVLWFRYGGGEVKLVGSELRGREWWYCLRVGLEYEYVRAEDFNFEATPLIR
jgi:hypothetical protein